MSANLRESTVRRRVALEMICPYEPGMPIEEVKRRLGLTTVVKLASNENPLGPSPRALETLNSSNLQLHIYPDYEGWYLREALARRLGVAVSRLILGAGSAELMRWVAEAYLDHGDEAIVADISFPVYANVIRIAGASPVSVALDAGMDYDLEGMLKAVTARTKVVFLASPNNPTGRCVPAGDLKAFLERLPANVLCVLDLAYAEYCDCPGEGDRVPLLAAHPNLVLLHTFSKVYGLAGLRIGYAVGGEEIIACLGRVRVPFSASTAAQVAARAALADDAHVARAVALNRVARALLSREMERLGLETLPSDANFLLVDARRDSEEVFDRLLRRGVIVRPQKGPRLATCLRVTTGTEEQMRFMAGALAEVLREIPESGGHRASPWGPKSTCPAPASTSPSGREAEAAVGRGAGVEARPTSSSPAAGLGDGGDERRRPVVLSVEQALAMPYATLRFVHLGWRVIRVEATPVEGRAAAGDPNRAIGREVAGPDRRAYFVAPNVGKEAVALDLKQPEGRALLRRLVRDLPVDVFCTNTLPAHHQALGIDYETLAAGRPELVWCAISALGLSHPDTPGYDPMVQALCGYMDLTGEPSGPPLQCGPPIIDLKAGDEAFTQAILALMERDRTGRGRRIDISMGRAAVSWLQTFLPMLDMGSPAAEVRRSGNQHRQFIPVNAYPTRDGFIYVAVGSDAQWRRLVEQPLFAGLDDARHATNEGRRAVKEALHAAIAAITARNSTAEMEAALAKAGVPHARITPIDGVAGLPFVAPALTRTTTPDGRAIRLPPPAVETPFLAARGGEIGFAPAYGEHTAAVLAEIGVGVEEVRGLRARGVIFQREGAARAVAPAQA